MPTITILESAPVLAPLVRAALPPGPVRLVPPGTDCDLAVLPPGWKGGPLPRCRTLLTPGPARLAVHLCSATARSANREPFPLPGDLPDPGIKPVSPALAGGFFTTAPPGEP